MLNSHARHIGTLVDCGSIEVRHIKGVAEFDLQRICSSHDINISYSFANAANDGAAPDAQGTVAKHAEEEEMSVCQL